MFGVARRHDHVYPAFREIRDELRETFLSTPGEPPFNDDVPSLDVADLFELLQELDPDRVRFDRVRPYRKQADL